jgi:hypothetical protein
MTLRSRDDDNHVTKLLTITILHCAVSWPCVIIIDICVHLLHYHHPTDRMGSTVAAFRRATKVNAVIFYEQYWTNKLVIYLYGDIISARYIIIGY